MLQGARSCYFASVQSGEQGVQLAGHSESQDDMPASSLFALENIIQQRIEQSQIGGKLAHTL